MKKLVLTRLAEYADRTLGVLHVYSGVEEQGRFCVLELPDKGNARMISSIPVGRYRVVPETNARFKNHFRVLGVEGRDGILIHRGNFPQDTSGCLLVGMRFADLDADGIFDSSQSDTAMNLLSQLVPDEAMLYVQEAAHG